MAKKQRLPSPATQPSASSSAVKEPLPWLWILGLTLLAFAIRVPFLGRSDLWVDELLFMWDSQLPMSPWEVWAHHYKEFPVAGHLPLGAMFHNMFLHLTGQDPVAVQYSPLLQRIPALFWGTLSVPVLYLAVRRIAGETVGRMTGVFFAVSFFPVFYSREAYHYAPLMFFSCASLLGFARLQDPVIPAWLRWTGWWLPTTAAVLTHISGVMLPLSYLVVGLGSLISTYVRKTTGQPRSQLGPAIIIPLLSMLPLLPFIMIRLAHPGMQNVSGAPHWWLILYDIIGKSFAGVAPVAFAIAVVCFSGGLAWLSSRSGLPRYLALVMALLILLITLGSLKSQYSARYFTVASPGIALIFAAGIHGLVARLFAGRPALGVKVGWGVIVLFALVHVVLFHRLAYQLEAKSRNYGGMARWVNANVPEGGAYLLESGYDVRFLGQYHRTTGRTPLVPFFHSTAADVQRLRDIHQDIMLKNPDVPFVEAARHGTEFNPSVPVWTWPHEYYRQHVDIWNRPLQKLVAMGIWPQIHAAGMPDIEYHTVIWYNTDEDCDAILRGQDRAVRFVYPDGWNFAQVAQGVYMRAHQPSRARIECRALGQIPATGQLRIVGAISAREPVMVRVEQDGRVLTAVRWNPGSVQEIRVPVFSMSSSTSDIWLATDPQKQASVQAILVQDVALE